MSVSEAIAVVKPSSKPRLPCKWSPWIVHVAHWHICAQSLYKRSPCSSLSLCAKKNESSAQFTKWRRDHPRRYWPNTRACVLLKVTFVAQVDDERQWVMCNTSEKDALSAPIIRPSGFVHNFLRHILLFIKQKWMKTTCSVVLCASSHSVAGQSLLVSSVSWPFCV